MSSGFFKVQKDNGQKWEAHTLEDIDVSTKALNTENWMNNPCTHQPFDKRHQHQLWSSSSPTYIYSRRRSLGFKKLSGQSKPPWRSCLKKSSNQEVKHGATTTSPVSCLLGSHPKKMYQKTPCELSRAFRNPEWISTSGQKNGWCIYYITVRILPDFLVPSSRLWG